MIWPTPITALPNKSRCRAGNPTVTQERCEMAQTVYGRPGICVSCQMGSQTPFMKEPVAARMADSVAITVSKQMLQTDPPRLSSAALADACSSFSWAVHPRGASILAAGLRAPIQVLCNASIRLAYVPRLSASEKRSHLMLNVPTHFARTE